MRGKQIIPLLRQVIEYRAVFDKVVKKGINEELLRMLLRRRRQERLRRADRLAPRIWNRSRPARMQASSYESSTTDGSSVKLGNLRIRLDQHTRSISSTPTSISLLVDSHSKDA